MIKMQFFSGLKIIKINMKKNKYDLLIIPALIYIVILSAIIPILHGTLYAPLYLISFGASFILILKLEKF